MLSTVRFVTKIQVSTNLPDRVEHSTCVRFFLELWIAAVIVTGCQAEQKHAVPVAAMNFSVESQTGEVLAISAARASLITKTRSSGPLSSEAITAQNARQLAELAMFGSVDGFAWSSDGSLLALSGQPGIDIFAVEKLQTMMSIPAGAAQSESRALAYFSSWTTLASLAEHYSPQLFSALGGQDITSLQTGHGRVFDLTQSPDGRLLVEGCEDRSFVLWEVLPGKLKLVSLNADFDYRHTAAVHRVGFSPDGRYLVSLSEDGLARLWGSRRICNRWPCSGESKCTA